MSLFINIYTLFSTFKLDSQNIKELNQKHKQRITFVVRRGLSLICYCFKKSHDESYEGLATTTQLTYDWWLKLKPPWLEM